MFSPKCKAQCREGFTGTVRISTTLPRACSGLSVCAREFSRSEVVYERR